jgi:hypothetical protein
VEKTLPKENANTTALQVTCCLGLTYSITALKTTSEPKPTPKAKKYSALDPDHNSGAAKGVNLKATS